MSAWLDVASTSATVVAAGFAAWSIGLARKQATANAEAIYRERRIDVDLERLRELVDAIEGGPHVAFAAATAQTALRMLSRTHSLPLARARFQADPTDANEQALRHFMKMNPTSPHTEWAVLQPALRDEALAAVRVALARRPTEPEVSERSAGRTWRTLWLVRRSTSPQVRPTAPRGRGR